LLLQYKNRFIDAIERQKLEPEMFSAAEDVVNGHPVFIITVRGEPSLKFVTNIHPESYHRFNCRYTRFEFEFPERGGYSEKTWINFAGILEVFEQWLKTEVDAYINETLQTDLWERIEGQIALVYTPKDREQSSSFSDEEKSQLRLLVSEFKLLVEKTFEPSEKECVVILERLNYLSDAIGRLNRIDWKALALSTMLSISIALSLDTENGKVLFALFKRVFSGVVHLLH